MDPILTAPEPTQGELDNAVMYDVYAGMRGGFRGGRGGGDRGGRGGGGYGGGRGGGFGGSRGRGGSDTYG